MGKRKKWEHILDARQNGHHYCRVDGRTTSGSDIARSCWLQPCLVQKKYFEMKCKAQKILQSEQHFISRVKKCRMKVMSK